ncbi:MAG TPA: hypothetical protein VFN97_13750 [Actinospica sp.]|nr:hypothetical protein [Actinospica sp.]
MLDIMTVWTLAEVEQAVRASWGADTCDPVAIPDWTPDNPSLGQCGTTALVIQDLLGGDLVLARVHLNGESDGNHYWNRFGPGIDIDFTREQFRKGQTLTEGEVVHRGPDGPRRCREEYELLRSRVLTRLGLIPPTT